MPDKVKHPVRNQTFELQEDGTILVEDLDEKLTGTFTRRGEKVSGALRYADPQMLDWIGGKAVDTP